jgi:hypothetical protein
MRCKHCGYICSYVGIGSNGRLTFEMWLCPICQDRHIGKKTFQNLIPDYRALDIAACFEQAAANPPGSKIRLANFPDDA